MKKKNNYFEGWYFKQEAKDKKIISFIPGRCINEKDSHAFIQVINNINNKSYYVRYDIDDFEYSKKPFYIRVGKSQFDMNGISINIDDVVRINGSLTFSNVLQINKGIYAPNIMGPFAYIPFMECNHGVLSLNHDTNGTLMVDDDEISFLGGKGYIEKDYGTSFPKDYLWIQATDNKDVLFLSIADIPFGVFNFKGLIGILYTDNKEYRFATYYMCKIKKMIKDGSKYIINLKQGKYSINIELDYRNSNNLIMPSKGVMGGIAKESLDSLVYVELYCGKEKLFSKNIKALSEIHGKIFK